MHAHVKSNMRSLLSSFRKSESKHIGYEWVSPSIEVDQQGRDIARTLEEIADLARQAVLKPQCALVLWRSNEPPNSWTTAWRLEAALAGRYCRCQSYRMTYSTPTPSHKTVFLFTPSSIAYMSPSYLFSICPAPAYHPHPSILHPPCNVAFIPPTSILYDPRK
jgi:hypothetical protein